MAPHSRIDWSQVYKRLTLIATVLSKSLPSVFDGISAEDLASEVVLKFLESEDHLGWDEEQNNIVAFLGGVLKHRFLDHLRRYKLGMRGTASKNRIITNEPGFDSEIESRSTIESLHQRVSHDEVLKRFVEAAISDEFAGGHNQNQELGEILNKTPAEIVNVRRRLVRLLKSEGHI